MLSLLYLRVKAQQYFESLSYMFLKKKTMLKIWLNPGLNLSSFNEPGPGVNKLIAKEFVACVFACSGVLVKFTKTFQESSVIAPISSSSSSRWLFTY